MTEPERSPLAVTGLGCICAAGRDLQSTMSSLFAGERNPQPPSFITIEHEVAYPVFEVPGTWLDSTPHAGRQGRCGMLALIAVREALANAELTGDELRLLRVGVCLGTVVGAALAEGEFFARYHRGQHPTIEPVLRFLDNNPSLVVHRQLGLSGPWQTVTTACTSGAAAVAVAASWVRGGVCDLAIAGGAEALSHLSYNGFATLRLNDPQPCRPFDRSRQGLNLGEGAGILILERSADAACRGATVQSWLVGDGNSSDAFHLSRPHPQGRGLRLAVHEALARAHLRPADVAFVNAHGTGTRENDAPEGRVLAELLPDTPFHSTKCYTGHTLGAAGAMEAVFSAAFLERGQIPATAGFSEIDPEIGVAPTTRTTEIGRGLALSTSVGYGGNNVALAFARSADA